MTEMLILFTFLVLALMIGIEIPFALGISTFLTVLFVQIPMNISSIAQIATGIIPDSVSLIAIPLFVFTGSLIGHSFLGERLILVANAIVGRIRGGLAVVNIVASFLFGGIQGSASADTAAIGGVLIPMMTKAGYDKDFSVVVTITSSCLGPIVPPSIIMIVFGSLTNTSIIGLFLGGYIPGLLLALALIMLSIYYSYKRDYPVSEGIGVKAALKIVIKQIPLAFLPVGVIGGIISGIFSPTEAGTFGVIYSFIMLIIYGEIKNVNYYEVLLDVVSTTAIACFLMAFAAVFSRFLILTRAPYYLGEMLMTHVSSAYVFLLFCLLIFLFLGCFMNPVAAMAISLPVLFPIATMFGIEPIHLGIVTTVSLAIGHVSPPVGISLFIGTDIAKIKIEEVIPMLIPYLLLMITVVIIIILFPSLIMWLPNLFGF